MLCIGIDSGTQSTKSIVVDVASGEVVASAQQTEWSTATRPEPASWT